MSLRGCFRPWREQTRQSSYRAEDSPRLNHIAGRKLSSFFMPGSFFLEKSLDDVPALLFKDSLRCADSMV